MPKKKSHLFIRQCSSKESHTRHTYVKHWRLVDLPKLPHPERYPESWDVTYLCQGLKLPGKTWAESLGITVPADAPGGQKLFTLPARTGLSGHKQNGVEQDYEGFHDNDAFRKAFLNPPPDND